MTLSSLPNAYRAAIFGAGGGLGRALADALLADTRCAQAYVGTRRNIAWGKPNARPFFFELEDEGSIASAAQTIASEGALDLAIVATGFLHAPDQRPEKSWRELDAKALQRAFAINAIGPGLIAKHVLPLLSPANKAVFAVLSARLGSISDNRLGGWHAYRASKAALNMLIRNFSVELARSRPLALCLALHPGTVDTALSRPFQSAVSPERLFSPEAAANGLLAVIDRLTPGQSGRFFAWDGAEILG